MGFKKKHKKHKSEKRAYDGNFNIVIWNCWEWSWLGQGEVRLLMQIDKFYARHICQEIRADSQSGNSVTRLHYLIG
jgi:hypothetical protein